MDLRDLKERVANARRVVHEIEHATFTLRIPSTAEMHVVAAQALTQAVAPAVASMLMRRPLLLECITGWRDVTTNDIDSTSQDATLVEFSREALGLLLDERDDWASELFDVLNDRIHQYRTRTRSAQKN